MPQRIGNPQLLVDFLSKQGLNLTAGKTVKVKILESWLDQAIVSWQGKKYLVDTELELAPGQWVDLAYQGINRDGKRLFRLVSTAQPDHGTKQIVKQAFAQAKIAQTPELINSLKDYHKLSGQALDSKVVAEFLLLVQTGLPLTQANLRLWQEFWQAPNAKDLLTQLQDLNMEEAEQLVRQLTVAVDGNDVNNTVVEMKEKLEPYSKIEVLFATLAAHNAAKAAVRESAAFSKLVVKLIEEFSAAKTLNLTNGNFDIKQEPLYLQVPLIISEQIFNLELLIIKEQDSEDNKSNKTAEKGYTVTLNIPTLNLGEVIALVKLGRTENHLEFIVENQMVMDFMRNNIAQVKNEHPDLFDSIIVVQDTGKVRKPKEQLLPICGAKVKSSVDILV